jgi:hypothetical protein
MEEKPIEISQTILKVVDMMNNYLTDILVVRILDTEMSRKYGNEETPLGYLGVTILMSIFGKEYRVFLQNNTAEDILFGSVGAEIMINSFILNILNPDLPFIKKKLELMIKNIHRKEKLKKLA